MVKITLFGLAGTGTSSVGKELSSRFNLEFNSSGNMFRELAQKNNMSLAEFGAYCEKNPDVDKELDASITQYGIKNDNFVFDSRLAWYTIPQSFKVKLECDENVRVQRIIEREGGDSQKVKEEMNVREQGNRKRYQEYYNIENYSDDIHFDIIIDTTHLTISQVCTIIALRGGLK
ncbi:MAG: (d)CMP kinase [Candidatus Woesearchaeota archaeon]